MLLVVVRAAHPELLRAALIAVSCPVELYDALVSPVCGASVEGAQDRYSTFERVACVCKGGVNTPELELLSNGTQFSHTIVARCHDCHKT